MNDSPVDCQNREWTEPQRDRWLAVGETEGVHSTPRLYNPLVMEAGGLPPCL